MNKYLSLKDTARQFNMSMYAIYELIKSDNSFPAVNVGVKKKYLINSEKLESWLCKRIESNRFDHQSIDIESMIRRKTW